MKRSFVVSIGGLGVGLVLLGVAGDAWAGSRLSRVRLRPDAPPPPVAAAPEPVAPAPVTVAAPAPAAAAAQAPLAAVPDTSDIARYRAAGVPEEALAKIAWTWDDLVRLDPARAAREAPAQGIGPYSGPFGWGPVFLNLPIGKAPTADLRRAGVGPRPK